MVVFLKKKKKKKTLVTFKEYLNKVSKYKSQVIKIEIRDMKNLL